MVFCIRALPALLISLFLLSAPASALTFSVSIGDGDSVGLGRDDFGCVDGVRDTFSCDAQDNVLLDPSGEWAISEWDLDLDPDPVVSLAFSVTNISNIVQSFTIVTTLPVANVFAATRIGGSMGGSITDANGNGLGGLSTVSGVPLYEALIDGVPVAGLHPDPFSLNFAFAGNSPSIPSTSFGLPGLTANGPALSSNIGIRLRFNLSPGDSIAITSVFIVDAIPEPSTALLLGGGLTALLAASRRLSLRG